MREESAHALLPEPFLEVPDRVPVRNLASAIKAEELLEAEAVEDLELGLILAQIVIALEHDDLEHEHRVVGRTAELRIVAGHAYLPAEELPVKGPVEFARWQWKPACCSRRSTSSKSPPSLARVLMPERYAATVIFQFRKLLFGCPH